MRSLLLSDKRLWRVLSFIAAPTSHSSSTSSQRTLTTITPYSLRLLSDLLSLSDCGSSGSANATSISPNCSVVDSRPWSAVQRRGVKVNAIHLKPGNVIEKSGRIYQVVDAEHRQRGRGGATMTLELRDVDSGSKQSLRFGTEEAVERVYVQEKSFTCLYTENETAYLMDPEKFEQLEVPVNLFGDAAVHLKEEMKVKLQLYDGRPLSGSVPKQVTCRIKETAPHVKGLTITNRYKKALLDNGLTVQVPPYLENGEEIVINTEENSFVSSDEEPEASIGMLVSDEIGKKFCGASNGLWCGVNYWRQHVVLFFPTLTVIGSVILLFEAVFLYALYIKVIARGK